MCALYKKYIYRRGKRVGPYYYTSERGKDGKVRTVYLGRQEPSSSRKSKVALRTNDPSFLVSDHSVLAIGFLFLVLGFFFFSQERVDISFGGLSLTGLSVLTEGNETNMTTDSLAPLLIPQQPPPSFTDRDLDQDFSLTTSTSLVYPFYPEEDGELRSFKVSGSVIGEGTVSIYLNDRSTLIYHYDSLNNSAVEQLIDAATNLVQDIQDQVTGDVTGESVIDRLLPFPFTSQCMGTCSFSGLRNISHTLIIDVQGVTLTLTRIEYTIRASSTPGFVPFSARVDNPDIVKLDVFPEPFEHRLFSPEAERGPDWVRVCTGAECVQDLYADPINIKDADGKYKPFTDVVTIKKISPERFTLAWGNERANVTIIPSGTPILSSLTTDILDKTHEYEFIYRFNLTNPHTKPLIEVESTTDVLQDGARLALGDIVINFEDAMRVNNFDVSTEKVHRKKVRAILNKDYRKFGQDIGEQVEIDPVVGIGGGGENITQDGDVFFNQSASTQYVRTTSNTFISAGLGGCGVATKQIYRAYIDFNTSTIPDNVEIGNVSLTLFMEAQDDDSTNINITRLSQKASDYVDNSTENQLLYNDIDGPTFIEQDPVLPNRFFTYNLSNAASTQIENSLGTNNFSVGIRNNESEQSPGSCPDVSTSDFSSEDNSNSSQMPILTVMYEGGIGLSSCTTLGTNNTEYTLLKDITSLTTCMAITATNITLNCDKYNITYGVGGGAARIGVNVLADNVTVHNCRIYLGGAATNSHGIQTGGFANANITRNTINTSACGNSFCLGIGQDQRNSYIGHNVLNTSNSVGVRFNPALVNALQNTTVVNNTLTQLVIIATTFNVTTENNTFVTAPNSAVALNAASNAHNITIRNNLLQNRSGSVSGINIQNAQDIIIEDNTIIQSGTGAAILLQLSTNKTKIYRNNISHGGTGLGVSILTNSSVVEIVDNTIESIGVTVSCSTVDYKGIKIQSNNLTSTGTDTINFASYCPNTQIIKNNITSFADDGITPTVNSSHVFVEGNSFNIVDDAVTIGSSVGINNFTLANNTIVRGDRLIQSGGGANLTAINETSDRYTFAAAGSPSPNVTVQWYFRVYIQNQNNVPLANADVNVSYCTYAPVNPPLLLTRVCTAVLQNQSITNSKGFTPFIYVTERIQNTSDNLSFNPFLVNASFSTTSTNNTFFNVTYAFSTLNASFVNLTLTGAGQTLTPPNITEIFLRPSQAYTNDTLNCTYRGEDASSTQFNVTVTFYKAGLINTTYTVVNVQNGTFNSTLLTAALQNKNELWGCAANATDTDGNGPTNFSANITILNSPPYPPTLSIPASGNTTTDRQPTFIWLDAMDEDNETLTYTLKITCYNSSSFAACPSPADNRLITGISSTSHELTSELFYFGDDLLMYNWTVNATDGTNQSAFAFPERNITINVLAAISLLTNGIDFMTMSQTQNNDTSDNIPLPLRLVNDGNSRIDINLSMTALFDNQGTNPSSVQFKVDNRTEFNSFTVARTNVTYANVVTGVGNPRPIIGDLNYTNSNDTADIDMNVTVPSSEPYGSKTAATTFTTFYRGL